MPDVVETRSNEMTTRPRKVLRVWFDDDDEPAKPNMPLMASELAAEVFAEQYRDDDHRPESYYVYVRTAEGKRERFEVFVAYEPTFLAVKLADRDVE